jgi:hypothetical protein
MWQFPSDRPDAGQQHVAGSQQAADERIARNMKRAAHKRAVWVVLTGSPLEIVVIVCVLALCVAGAAHFLSLR